MNGIAPLPPQALRLNADPNQFDFTSTDTVQVLDEIIGQKRALEAIHFGIGVRAEGYNLYIMGAAGMGKRSSVHQYLDQYSKTQTNHKLVDWCYVYNFHLPNKPIALPLKAGLGMQLKEDMAKLIKDLSQKIPAIFDSEEYKSRLQQIEQKAKAQEKKIIKALRKKARKQSIELSTTNNGFSLSPIRNGKILSTEEFQKLPEKEREKTETLIDNLQEELQHDWQQAPEWLNESREKTKQLTDELSKHAITPLVDKLIHRYQDLETVVAYLNALKQNALDNIDDFLPQERDSFLEPTNEGMPALRRYQVNLVVDNSQTKAVPIIYLNHPTYANLVGKTEYVAQMGALTTDFTLIKAGGLHCANGGYLIIDARRLLDQPYAWEGLKRALYAKEIQIESLEEALTLVNTVSLEPQPIPLDVKIILLGDAYLYYMLQEYDEDFVELFKVVADFDHSMARNPENHQLYAQLIATLLKKHRLASLDRPAVAAVIDHAARLVDDSEKLTTHMSRILDLLHEAHHFTQQQNQAIITADHIQQAISAQRHRHNRLQHEIYEDIQRGDVLIQTQGTVIGQINALSVIQLGYYSFGQPSRITAVTRLGYGDVIDIEKESNLGGNLHTKGMMILSSFLAERYARNRALSLSASLVFEQSYAGVDGDSASLAELCALLSSLSGLAIKQSLAITGSIDQKGHVQAIGGVNEKIEGFFAVCQQRGLTGEHGVLIPASNVKHLMLEQTVVDAVVQGLFHVYAVHTVDEAIRLLTDCPAGELNDKQHYPKNTVNGKVQRRLKELLHLQNGKDPKKDKRRNKKPKSKQKHTEELKDNT